MNPGAGAGVRSIDEAVPAEARTHQGALWAVLRRPAGLAGAGRAGPLRYRQAPLNLGADPRLSAGTSARGTGADRCRHLSGAGAPAQRILPRTAKPDSRRG